MLTSCGWPASDIQARDEEAFMSQSTSSKLSLGLMVLAGSAAIAVGGYTLQVSAQEPDSRPPLLFQETWQQAESALGEPTSSHRSNNQYYLAAQSVVTNSALDLGLYGYKSGDITVYAHEGRIDLWTGLVGSSVALTLKDRANYMDLTGLSRVRAIVRTNNLHVLHPVVKLADGTLLAGSQVINTNGAFLSAEVAFDNQRWFNLDPEEVATGSEVADVDLSRVDEVGFVDLAPAGGHGNAGWVNISTFEVYASPVPR